MTQTFGTLCRQELGEGDDMTKLAMAGPITVLNATYEPLNNVSLQRAIHFLHLGKAEIVEAVDDVTFVISAGGVRMWPMPKIIRLLRYVRVPFEKMYGPAPLSKRGVLSRDDHKCAYCDGNADTVDHVIPRSRGGKSDWLNLVAACKACNNKKSNRTPREAGMELRVAPYAPRRRPRSLSFVAELT